MATHQTYHNHRLEITTFELSKALHILFVALFLTAVFIVPTIGVIMFLFI